ncbi:ATP-binding protein [Desulfotruncus alcoholivorax]|uniref:ATP-binding protein n=1 Tax=Desulfotruncus alcoholivorax TaxID=265477 RepID=UPI00041A4723|nr:ATP-binding protein [Desulfotruncus alcoholivorax]
MDKFKTIIHAIDSLAIYRSLLSDPVLSCYLDHLKALVEPSEALNPAVTYSKLYYQLAQTVNPMESVDPWQNHLLDLLLDDVNPFSKAAYNRELDHRVYLEAVRRDLELLHLAFETGLSIILEATQESLKKLPEFPRHLVALPRWVALAPSVQNTTPVLNERIPLKYALASAKNWDKHAEKLAEYYAAYGCGVFGRYIAFKWENHSLRGVSRPDPITFSDLIGYTDTRAEIIDNTKKFINGAPANNILLYGDRGTGKSSTVKALLNEYWSRGLRLIEVGKKQLANFPAIIGELNGRKHRFILFVDDLSFEEHETGYKDLKALLEGGLEEKPENVLIYATSNRRHLVRETFADREANLSGQEIHAMDSVQEKLSLADRFGITVIFPNPDQELFLEIVQGLARQRNLRLDPQDLRRRALQWASWHNGRSPRSARQFIDHLTGEKLLAESSLQVNH